MLNQQLIDEHRLKDVFETESEVEEMQLAVGNC